MFTGLIQSVGALAALTPQRESSVFQIRTQGDFLSGVELGDSIAVNGVCLTVTSLQDANFNVDVSAETLRCTTFETLLVGQSLNLEKALTLSQPLGGHLVTGHVDGVGEVTQLTRTDESIHIVVQAPEAIAKYIARKGSICMDGVSLTVNQVEHVTFEVNIIPHTWENTAILDYQVGTNVNLEIDLLARYVERMHEFETSSNT
jgi:riboflavin synthase